MTIRAQLRTIIRQRRRSFSHEQQKEASERLLQRLIQQDTINEANNIAIYLANDGELNPLSFIHWCWQKNKNVYLPVIHPFCKGQLLFLHYQDNTTMVQNKYDIAEPKLDIRKMIPVNQLDIIFTPLVAFDQHGSRLGMGGGFYDRTLIKVNPLHTKIVGLAHDYQEVKQIPIESWDIPLPQIITPSKNFTV
jgi:5-formyltetrahydrofolate cyclo-ligase